MLQITPQHKLVNPLLFSHFACETHIAERCRQLGPLFSAAIVEIFLIILQGMRSSFVSSVVEWLEVGSSSIPQLGGVHWLLYIIFRYHNEGSHYQISTVSIPLRVATKAISCPDVVEWWFTDWSDGKWNCASRLGEIGRLIFGGWGMIDSTSVPGVWESRDEVLYVAVEKCRWRGEY